MRVVERAEKPPAMCIATGISDGPFVDFEARSPHVDPHVYMRVSVVEKAAGVLGMVSGEDHNAAMERLAELEAENERLRNEVDEADRFQNSIRGIAAQGFTVQKRQGRPKAKVA